MKITRSAEGSITLQSVQILQSQERGHDGSSVGALERHSAFAQGPRQKDALVLRQTVSKLDGICSEKKRKPRLLKDPTYRRRSSLL